MADFNEDAIAREEDLDLTDETQDFRFLAHISATTEQPGLPRRGEKDFELYGTTSQQDALATSRGAMHAALAFPRVHAPKSTITAVYDTTDGHITVENPRGQHFRTMGKADVTGRLHLLPEEALYLVERGNLCLRWPPGYMEELEGLPFSLQSAYAVIMGNLGLTVERYIVYTGLKRSGYIVHRAPDCYSDDVVDSEEPPSGKPIDKSRNLFSWLYDLLPSGQKPEKRGPLAGPGLYRSYQDIYAKIAVIPSHGISPHASPALRGVSGATIFSPSPSFHLSYHVWKPRPDFRKSAPGPPDFRIAVVDAREDVPVLSEFDNLLNSMPYDPPPTSLHTQLSQKLKHGWRNVILAIVDQGVVSYLRVSDTCFVKERAYERSARGHGAKGSGRGGSRRGRGFRGRGG